MSTVRDSDVWDDPATCLHASHDAAQHGRCYDCGMVTAEIAAERAKLDAAFRAAGFAVEPIPAWGGAVWARENGDGTRAVVSVDDDPERPARFMAACVRRTVRGSTEIAIDYLTAREILARYL